MSETSAVQRPMLKYAYQIGWEYLTSKEALQRREGKGEEKLKERYFADVLRSQLIKLNPGVVTSNNIDEVLRRLRNIDNTIEGNREALNWLQGKQSIFVAQENRDRNITLIDFNNPENNIFQVTDEWSQKGVKFPNRADIIFLINGIPIAIAETKGEKKTDGLALGIDQIRRYHNQTPELLAFPQVFEVTELWNFWYGLTWNTNRKNLFEWKLTSPLTPPLVGEGNNNITPAFTPPSLVGKGAGGLGSIIQEGDYEEKIKTFFDYQRFLDILRYYIVFLERDDGLTKVVLRQHQTRAVKKVLQRIQDPNKKRGLVWHTQGSGKTLTMITIAAQLRNISGDNTVIVIVDRNELENQLDKNLKAYSIKSYEVATSKADLEKLIQDDYRGLIVAMIHKFDKMKVENKRSTITVLVDEAHRSTGGNFGIYLMAALPNATFIGFTGTPVSKAAKGQSTFQTFGEPTDPKYSLDSYSTADSVRDGTTLKLNYALAKSEFRVPQEILEKEFLQLKAAEDINDIEELDDPDLRPFMENYQAIARLYGTIRAAYNTSPYIDIELTAKTKELVRRNVTIGELEMPGTIHELNAQQLEQFRQNSTTDTVKVLNLSKALLKTVNEQSQRSPFLISIGERAETVRASFENRQIEAHVALAKLDEIANECIEAESERQRLKVDENTFAIYTVIKQAVDCLDINQAETINAIYSNFPDYWWDARQEIDLRTELYATIYPITSSVEQTIEVTNNLLKLERVES
ncbi:HsdR family type I site-specific deoxyribonuclease [Nostoc sp. 'Peltigera membranacea cyanobiont' 232]|uniref:HsdR family type I site-specific deoxyribonuclease n=1 Tax=Nostoc sp. 'Peltigera membranacea cyanobiont' 232 TaxID=2014531 RepID=UPI000B956A24|nr:HsdR family type I site-specific deoxyribonuclease [Nostoc sp. 'Peltigera membranacea cyanobiont' 232]OYE04965.1 hypothetical protein CDG79_10500 [Nostoc sp. 'Peltigera membranacea cyanobiont' 232]